MNAAAPEGAPAADLNNGLLKSQNQEIVINFRDPLTAGPGATRRGVAPTPRSGVGNILINAVRDSAVSITNPIVVCQTFMDVQVCSSFKGGI
jgi:hypothetical protein